MARFRGTLRDNATIGVEQKRPMLTPGFADLALLDGHYLRRSDAEIFGEPADRSHATHVSSDDERARFGR